MKKKFLFIFLLIFVASASLFVACGKVDFKLNFVVDGEVYATISTNGKETIKLPDNPTKDGYVFDGWYFDSEVWEKPFTADSLLSTPLSIDMYVYAKFTKEEAIKDTQAEFIGFEKVSENKYCKKVSNDTEILSLDTLVKVDSKSSWIASYDVSCTKVILSKIVELTAGDNLCYVNVTDENGNMSLYTLNIRRREIYEVSFADCDIQPQYIEEDFCAVAPATANRNGYTFESWDFDFTTPIVENTVISAKWNVVTYNIEYELNGGKNNSANPTTYNIESGDIVLQTPAIQNEDYDGFIGWFSDKELRCEVQSIEQGSYGNKTFYAKWSSKYYLFDTYNKTITGVTYYAKTCSSLVIPDKINGIDVFVIGDSAFSDCSKLKSVTIPDGVKSISEYAFRNCSGLINIYYAGDVAGWCGISGLENIMSRSRTLYIGGKRVEGELVIPNSVKNISKYAFWNCIGLTSVTITDSVISIGDWAFWGCTGLTSVTIGNSVMRIGSYAFWKCAELTSVIIPDSVAIIGNSAFDECTGLISVTIGNSVTSIGDSAFLNCARLTSVTIPDNVESIGDSAFNGCTGLTSMIIGSSVASIGDYAFYICTRLTSVTIPNSVTSIGDYAFYGCARLTSLIIGNSVISVGDYAFNGCAGLTSMTIPGSVTSIGNYAFNGCTGLTTMIIPNSVTNIGEYVFNGCMGLASVTIGNGVTSIGSSTFRDCAMLSSVTIPDSVKSISEYAFRNCDRLTSIYYAGDVASWCGISGLVNIMSTSRTLYIGGKKVEGDLVIPNSVKSISKYAFYGCVGLTSVTIPGSVVSIGDYAFSYCTGLTSVTIGDGVTSIGWSAFSRCSKIEKIVIPITIKNIEDYAFEKCASLKTIYYKGTEEQWNAIKKEKDWNCGVGDYTIVYNA